ncbi:MAG: 30S ribosomal protein S8 [Candidatus Diapherotrites archaeon]|uniref:Small ribosomal subunit protein uS8 n=1 Tax=Candidatus Iainarchaeum sp. TaxID=3101447 RepID=A0A7J4IU32_9ARCH|nr:MAG: 30S ribosomal protein S8, small subunit ribosomal protein S8 [archaeon GW2011_AR10]AJS11752.1 30S ribosomal protein S8 [uncultured archaeon]MBS3059361.1 30S ribosomal protein S8 [Candidatus Diapherotrites archaeon]HIH08340.1 30S ribosomal protein S8 [Candidatus Diapherotrites archaeon]
MVRIDPLADALINIKNNENASKKACNVRPASKLLGEVLRVMQEQKYISTYELIDDGREGIFKIELLGKINECKAIKPRYPVKSSGFEKYEMRYLPARNVGMIIVTTSEGVMSHKDAKEKYLGGRLLAYVY